ncbi:MAG: hypothetical protein JJT81_17585 [Rubellimicrobium sp.]|nr:hypothetical protein [Rubellimicrobium sp.]
MNIGKIITSGSLAATFVCAAAIAGADCIGTADLSRGIVVTFDNGDSTQMQRMGDGLIELLEIYADGGSTWWFRARHGIYFVEEAELDPQGNPYPGSQLVIDFGMDLSGLPVPVAGESWSGETVNIFDDGYRRPEVASYIFSADGPLVLDGCEYEVVRADVRYDWEDEGGMTLHYSFLPALGTAILIASQMDGDEELVAHPVAIERLRK